ncbi:hypothetical protein [Corynebacterium cystitidis]|nr:hypothetical protein [Corynebacterium cystitidis]
MSPPALENCEGTYDHEEIASDMLTFENGKLVEDEEKAFCDVVLANEI